MFADKPVIVSGLFPVPVTPPILAPVPGVKPVAPNSTFQSVSVPPAVQVITASDEVILEDVRAVGSKHEGGVEE